MKITVTRFDPSQDASPYEQSFEVPYRDNITALEALMHIYENEEPIALTIPAMAVAADDAP